MILAIPIWNGWYRDVFIHWALPSIKAALEGVEDRPIFVIHTDIKDQLAPHLTEYEVVFRPVTGDGGHESFGLAHRDAIDLTPDREIIFFLAADLVVSVELFRNALKRFATHKLVMCSGTRTLSQDGPPAGAKAAALHRWSWYHRHPIVKDLVWPVATAIPSMIYFQTGDSVSLRSFHMHPLACIKDRPMHVGVTVDDDLPSSFAEDEIHIVTDPNELCLVECSPAEKMHPRCEGIGWPGVAMWAMHRTNPRHRWFFSQRTVIQGSGIQGFEEQHVVEQIQKRLA